MPDRLLDDARADLAALVAPLARTARLLLLLDERQPDALRAEALTMPPERLFWTLTQLDDGLDLDACQALVRAARLSQRRQPVPAGGRAIAVLEAAARVATTWLEQRWAALPAVITTPLTVGGVLAPAATTGPAVVTSTGGPAPAAPCHWLDLPPVVGPPPGTADLSIAGRIRAWFRVARR